MPHPSVQIPEYATGIYAVVIVVDGYPSVVIIKITVLQLQIMQWNYELSVLK